MENRVTQLVRGKLAQFGLFVLWPSACNSIHDLIFECFDTFFYLLSISIFEVVGASARQWRTRKIQFHVHVYVLRKSSKNTVFTFAHIRCNNWKWLQLKCIKFCMDCDCVCGSRIDKIRYSPSMPRFHFMNEPGNLCIITLYANRYKSSWTSSQFIYVSFKCQWNSISNQRLRCTTYNSLPLSVFDSIQSQELGLKSNTFFTY